MLARFRFSASLLSGRKDLQLQHGIVAQATANAVGFPSLFLGGSSLFGAALRSYHASPFMAKRAKDRNGKAGITLNFSKKAQEAHESGTITHGEHTGHMYYRGAQIKPSQYKFLIDPYGIHNKRHAVQEKKMREIEQRRLARKQFQVLGNPARDYLDDPDPEFQRRAQRRDRRLLHLEPMLLDALEKVVYTLKVSERFGELFHAAGFVISAVHLHPNLKKAFVIWDVALPLESEKVEKVLGSKRVQRRLRFLLAREIKHWRQIPELEFFKKGTTDKEFEETYLNRAMEIITKRANEYREARVKHPVASAAPASSKKKIIPSITKPSTPRDMATPSGLTAALSAIRSAAAQKKEALQPSKKGYDERDPEEYEDDLEKGLDEFYEDDEYEDDFDEFYEDDEYEDEYEDDLMEGEQEEDEESQIHPLRKNWKRLAER